MPLATRVAHCRGFLTHEMSAYIIADYSEQTIPIINIFSPDMYRATVGCIACATRVFGKISETQTQILYSAMYRYSAGYSNPESWLSSGIETFKLLSLYTTLLIETFQSISYNHWNGLIPAVHMTEAGFVTDGPTVDCRQVYLSYFNDDFSTPLIYLFGAYCESPGSHYFYTDNYLPGFDSHDHLITAQDNSEVVSYYPNLRA